MTYGLVLPIVSVVVCMMEVIDSDRKDATAARTLVPVILYTHLFELLALLVYLYLIAGMTATTWLPFTSSVYLTPAVYTILLSHI